MAITKRFRERGANITVTAAGEVLFMPGGQVHGWTRRFGNQARKWTEAAAPVNKRPRWGHYGKPLKQTIIGQPARFRQTGAGGARVYATVGSSAPHAYYVDQGTGIYNGRGPYQAKILPPWVRQSPSLYEATWKVPTSSSDREGRGFVAFEEVGTVTVKGQKGQHFFAAGLDRAFLFMIRSGQRSAAGKAGLTSKIGRALNELPHGMDDFKGNTANDSAFRASLEEWREWRDRAWYSGKVLGMGINKERTRRELREIHEHLRKRGLADIETWRERKARAAERSRRYRARVRDDAAKNMDKPKQTKSEQALQLKRQRALAAFQRQNPGVLIVKVTDQGIQVRVKGRIAVIGWVRLYGLL